MWATWAQQSGGAGWLQEAELVLDAGDSGERGPCLHPGTPCELAVLNVQPAGVMVGEAESASNRPRRSYFFLHSRY